MLDVDIGGHGRILGDDRLWIINRSWIAKSRFYLKIIKIKVRGKLQINKKKVDNVDYLFDDTVLSNCRDIINRVRPDVIIVVYVHFSKILELAPSGVLRVLDTQDSFSNEFTANSERKGLERADLILAIQDKEAALFEALLADMVSPPCVGVVSHIVGKRRTVNLSQSDGATFLGSNFEANNKSLAAFILNVMPIVLGLRPAFKLHVIGDVGTSIPNYPFVIKHGRVHSVEDAIGVAPILVNYIIEGTGIKVKLLDTMAMGVPCVSTRFGAVGLPAEFSDGVVIAEDDMEFASKLIELFDNPNHRASLGTKCKTAIERWDIEQKDSLKRHIDAAEPKTRFNTR